MGKILNKKRINRYQGEDVYKKYTFMKYDIGKEKRRCWVKFPKNSYREKLSIARKFLRFNYASSRNIRKNAKCCTKMSPEEWHKEFERQKGLPLGERYRYYGMHRTRMWRKSRNPLELLENRKAYGQQGSSKIPASVLDENDDAIIGVTLEDCQCISWLKPMQKLIVSVEMNEIISHVRMAGKSWDGSRIIPSFMVIFMESVRAGLFSQDWKLVAKSMEGIFTQAVSRTFSRHQITWNAGLLSVLRFTNNDRESVKEFARTFKDTFKPKVYGRRLGNEVGIWLAQEGFFNESILFLEEMDVTPTNGGYYHMPKYRLPFNPKRDLIDLMTNLLKAVFLYSIWKRDSNSASEGLYCGSEDDLQRSGENALSAFEALLELAQDCEAEVTTFLEPLIELTVQYRSPLRAKALYKELVIRHYGNAFLEGAYLKFLKHHFPESEIEIKFRSKLKRKFKFIPEPHWSYQKRLVSAYRAKKIEQMTEKVCLKRIPNPEFSW